VIHCPRSGVGGDGIVFSINNKHVIQDALLTAERSFFNIHAGLVQQYRGIAEVCIFCRTDPGRRLLWRYASSTPAETEGRLPVPVVAQLQFAVDPEDRFCDLLQKSVDACQAIFESNVRTIAESSYRALVVDTAAAATIV